ncbi:unnamed protein product [Schistosoma margrebowiei]|uniref:Uncharacterized protein n=1 Tax=Schistosoma margrebowiei TaxID=48269 RepID=A0A183MXD4_9TREM|nr:unnamed protein product [Schistosoma margrebowiei]
MICSDDSHISDEISYKSEENMLSESNHDRKPYTVLIDSDFYSDPSLFNEILNEFEGNISEKSNLDVISNVIRFHNAFVYCGELVQCKARGLNELDLDHNSDDFISTVISPYHEVTSNEYSNQYKNYDLNEAATFITWGY